MSTSTRPRVLIITAHWGEADDEVTMATRLVAGALAQRSEVEVVHLVDETPEMRTVTDSVFLVHRVVRHGAHLLRAGIVRAALSDFEHAPRIPRAAAAVLERYEGDANEVLSIVDERAPNAIVLAGVHQPFDIEALASYARRHHVRTVFMPFSADPTQLDTNNVQHILRIADAIAVNHMGEEQAVRDARAPKTTASIVALDLALPINRSGTTQGLFGVRFFGSYVLLLRNFPPSGARFERTVTHEVLRQILGTVSVAEVDGEKWRISDAENTLEFPVNPSRVNLWRLMAHALVTVDVRPPGPVGREAIESMLLGTPVIVPEPSAAKFHVAAANGGLWYRDVGELFDAARALMSARLRGSLATQARAYAEVHHGNMDDFTDRMALLVLNAAE